MKNVGLFGIGAIGSLITKYITRNPSNNCTFYNRSDKNSISIQYNDQRETIPIHLSSTENQNLDWLIVCLKAYHFEVALPSLKNLIKANTKVAIFQNGINLSAPYFQLTKVSHILETILDCPIQKINNEEILQIRTPKIILPKHELTSEFIQLFKGNEITFQVNENFLKSQWLKLIESSAIGSIQSLTGKPCAIFSETIYLTKFVELVEEGIKVAHSEGIHFEKNLIDLLVTKLKGYPPTKGSSMLTDKLAGHELELDAKIGAILKVALRNEVKVPRTQNIYNSLLYQ